MLRSARRLLRRKDRLADGLFLVEGRQAVGEAISAGSFVERVLVSEPAFETHRDLLAGAAAASVPTATVPDRAFRELTDTVTPQGVLAVCRTVDVPPRRALTADARLVVLCDRIRDPGNLGTVIRCADAFGADAVLISADSVDVYNPKAVRASTGSIFHLPIVVGVDLALAVDAARAAGLTVLGADGTAATTIDDLSRSGQLAEPTMWVLGNEAWGLTTEHAALLDRCVALPIYGRAESLNLSTAAAVLLYATATAQRSRYGPPGRSESSDRSELSDPSGRSGRHGV